MITLLDILIVVAILGLAAWGWFAGCRAAVIAGLEVVVCLTLAVVFHEWLAGVLHSAVTLAFGDSVSVGWSVLVAFATLAWGSFGLLRTLHRPPADDDEAGIEPLVDRLAGAVAGAVGGAVFVGGLLVTLSMVPFLAGLKPSGDRMLVDVGKLALRTAGHSILERHEGSAVPLWGEPPSTRAVAAARLTSEPWFDADGDGVCGDADRYRDVDGNGTFSKDLFYVDVDGDGLRRIGMVDKYVVGRWDSGLVSEDRPRTDTPEAAKAGQPGPVAQPGQAVQPAKPGQPPKPGGRTSGTAPAAEEKKIEDDF